LLRQSPPAVNSRVIGPWHPDTVIEPRFSWRFPAAVTIDDVTRAAGARHGLDERVTGLLAGRGIIAAADFDAFFAPPLEALHDPALLPDAAAFGRRIREARERGERVLVFGDFDADGLTGLAILTIALERLGIEVIPYVPSRLEEGHGLSLAAVAAATEAGARVIVTVDCGSTSAQEIAAAVSAGIDVLVTDHHRVPPELPAAVAIVNPKRPDSQYPDRLLAGSGVAFKLAQLLLADEPGGPEAALELADLATIGSVADMVPILGETRAIVRLGLEQLRANPRPGIAALLASANAPLDRIDTETHCVAAAPSIYGAGRMV
jgi:single-stranded-DNA-specific exonuclease